jgi:uncharacterized damage-inducible protein DinB
MTRILRQAFASLTVAVVFAAPALAQSAATDYRDEFLNHFAGSARKVEQLSVAVPAELYTWSPGEGVMSIARVYAHIARYNYMYLDEQLGIKAPDAVDWQNFESITDKEQIVALLAASIAHVKTAAMQLGERDLMEKTRLYGRDVPGWAVLSQLIAHMNEHVGQSIAYARMNGIVPPGSS